jgi:hypothetical protein
MLAVGIDDFDASSARRHRHAVAALDLAMQNVRRATVHPFPLLRVRSIA